MKRLVNYLAERELLGVSVVLLLSLLVFLAPQLLQGGYFAPSDIIRVLGGPFANDFRPHNSLLSDVLVQFVPWFKVSREILADGSMPLWNIYSGGGLPLMANMQAQTFWPLSLFIYLFNFKLGLLLYAAGKLFLTGFFSYLFLKEIRLSKAVALIGAIALMFVGFNFVWLMWPHTNAVFLMPLGFYLVERYFRTEETRLPIWFALAFALGFFGGHPETFFHVVFVVALFFIYKLAVTWVNATAALKHFGRWAGAVILGVGLSAILLLPFAEYLQLSQALVDRTGHVNQYYLPHFALILNFIPDLFGNPAIGDRYYAFGPNLNYNESVMGYVGVTFLFLAFFACIRLWKQRLVGFFIFMAALCAAVSYHFPVIFDLITKLPGFDAGANHRLMLMFGFAVVVLGCIGLQHLIEASDKKRSLAITAGIFVVVALGLFWLARTSLSEYLLPGRTIERVILWQNLMAGVFGLNVTALLILVWRIEKRAWLYALGILIFLETGAHASIYNTASSKENFYPEVPVVQYLEKEFPNGYYKTLAEGTMLAPNLGSWYGFNTISDNDAVGISNYTPLKKAVGEYKSNWEVFDGREINADALAFLGGKYLVVNNGSVPIIESRYPGRFSSGYQDNRVTVLTQPALPRAYFVAATQAELETKLKALQLSPNLAEVHAAESYVLEKNGDESIKITTPSNGYLVLNENYYPGWVATDNGQAVTIENAYGLRAIPLTAGTHSLETSYQPKSFRYGAIISLVSLLAWVGLLFVSRRRTS